MMIASLKTAWENSTNTRWTNRQWTITCHKPYQDMDHTKSTSIKLDGQHLLNACKKQLQYNLTSMAVPQSCTSSNSTDFTSSCSNPEMNPGRIVTNNETINTVCTFIQNTKEKDVPSNIYLTLEGLQDSIFGKKAT